MSASPVLSRSYLPTSSTTTSNANPLDLASTLPIPPAFTTSPDSSYSSQEMEALDHRVAEVTISPATDTLGLKKQIGDAGSVEGENEGRSGGDGGMSPDWRASIVAQRVYSAAIHAYTEAQWEMARVDIEKASSSTKTKR